MTSKRWIDSNIWLQCEQAYLADPQAYLTLQDQFGVNVNLLLLAEQMDLQLKCIVSDHWQQLAHTIERWEHTIVQPYRQLRRLAKANLQQDEYQKMLNVELMLERKSQRLILNKLNKLQPAEPICAPVSASKNIATYLNDCNVPAENIHQWCNH